jgi:dolichol-phosphate mannosyltransferase
MKLSVITTAYNEEENIIQVYERIKKAMPGKDCEIIAVDDGSTDKTCAELRKIRDERLKVIRLKENRGKSFALYEGLKRAKGRIIATIDADGQNDPRDIPRMVKTLGTRYDCVFGWRYKRRDGPIKKISSKIANSFNNRMLGVNLHDNACPVKVFRRECVSKIRYFENFHRFIPAMIKLQGFRIRECRVNHYPRIHGTSKYGIGNRLFGNLKTLFMVKFKHRELLRGGGLLKCK